MYNGAQALRQAGTRVLYNSLAVQQQVSYPKKYHENKNAQIFRKLNNKQSLYQTVTRNLTTTTPKEWWGKKTEATSSNVDGLNSQNDANIKNLNNLNLDNNNNTQNTSNSNSQHQKQNDKTFKKFNKLFTIGCGFSKDDDPRIIIDPIKHCINQNSGLSTKFGEDSAFIYEDKNYSVLGISDGVGGWRESGVDPSLFSNGLMSNCKEMILNLKNYNNFKFDITNPVSLLDIGYNKLKENEGLLGSATACILNFDKKTGNLYTANLGDSGFLVIRNNKIVHQSKSQQHFFNCPFQLAMVPKDRRGNINDLPKDSDTSQFLCQEGDIIVLATDGVYDNVHLQHILELLKELEISKKLIDKIDMNLDEKESGYVSEESTNSIKSLTEINEKVERAASTFVAFARQNAHNQNYTSPFTLEAAKYGKRYLGGKVDDITILISVVGKQSDETQK